MKRADVQKAAQVIKACAPEWKPKFAVILGSGLDAVMDSVVVKAELSYADIPGFPVPKVAGHAGKAVLGSIGDTDVLVLKGRQHMYENPDATPLKTMVRTVQELGADFLFLTNAVGGLKKEHVPGTLVNITEHINMMGCNPLQGDNDDDFGGRFFAMNDAWDANLNDIISSVAQEHTINLKRGVYVAVLGPNFETPAETRMFAQMGGDTVGMSCVPECLIARHCGLKVVGVSAVTNLAAHLTDVELSHEQTLEGAKLAEQGMATLIKNFALKL